MPILNYPLDLLRAALGVFLFVKGIDFMSNPIEMAEVANLFRIYRVAC